MRTSLVQVSVLAISVTLAHASDGVWTAGAGVWTNSASWSGGVIPGAGDSASFLGSGGMVTLPAGFPFNLSSLLFNTNGVYGTWTLTGETNTLVAPAEVRVEGTTYTGLTTISNVLTGTAGLTKTGTGILELGASANLFSGPVKIAGNGMVRVRSDLTLGTMPASPTADAIILDGGVLANLMDPLTVSVNRGISVGASNGWLISRNFATTTINSAITGTGSVFIARHNGSVVFKHPDNAYLGNTTLGAFCVGTPTDGISLLQLGADEVIPHGAGKGKLVFDGAQRGILDLNGKTETVNTVLSSGDLCITNSASQPGVLKAGLDNANMGFGGDIRARATLEKIGSGRLIFADNGRSQGGIKVTDGTLDFSHGSSLGTMTVTLDGGSLNMTNTQPGLVESMTAIPDAYLHPWMNMTETSVRIGTIMANLPLIGYPDYTQYGYKGQMYVPSESLYSFAKNFDNGGYLAIDGVTYISNNVLGDVTVVRNVNLSAGWHALDVIVSQGSSLYGPNAPGFTGGIMFDPSNGPFTNASEIIASAKRFEDPGDGSLLRTLELTGTNVVRAHLELVQNGTLNRAATPASLVWAGDIVTATNAIGTPALTVAGGTEAFHMGATNRSVVFHADVNDPNGVVFQDKVWLANTPVSSTWSIMPGAEIALGTPGILGTGTMTLTNFSVRIPSSDALGSGGETVTVDGMNNSVWFDATREQYGMLLNDAAYAFTASNNVIFSGTGARAGFDGAGTVTYTGTISGNGSLVKNGSGDAMLTAANSFLGNVQVNAGRLRVSDDAQLGNSANAVTLAGGYLGNASGTSVTLARNVQVTTSGGFDVQDSELVVNGVISGTATKRGAGTVTFGGAAPNSAMDLSMSAGTAVLDKSGAVAVRNITGVGSSTTVRLAGTGGNQIAGNVSLAGGTLDLNGRSEMIGQLNSATVSSVVTNGGGTASVLTVGETNVNSYFRGLLTDGNATLSLTKIGSSNTFALLGGSAAQRYTGPTRVEGGTMEWGAGVRYVRLAVTLTRTANQPPAISEFQLLRDGVYVPCPADTVATVSSSNGPTGGADRLIDNNTVSKWLANASSGQALRIDLRRPMAINGYRWYTANDAPERDPVSWTIEISADAATWYTADTRVSQPITSVRSVMAFSGNFTTPFTGGCALAPGSAVTVNSNALANVFSMNESATSFAGSGRLFLATDLMLSVGNLSGFSGRLTGDGRLFVGGSGGETVFSHLSCSPGQTIVNNGSATLAVRVGGTTNASFSASVRDGLGVAGIVKRGSQTVLLHGASSSYTGETRVEEGTLAVLPGTLSYRYLRFTPTEKRGADTQYPISMAEFQLLRNGAVAAYPSGSTATTTGSNHSSYPPSKAIDGDISNADTNRWITTSFPTSLIIDMKQVVTFDGYQWYTSSGGADPARDPLSWKFEASQDGATWTLLDVRISEPVANIRNLLVGPYVLGNRATVPPEFWTTTNSLQEKVTSVTARYLRFNPTQMRAGAYEFYNDGFQLSELQLLTNGAPVRYPAGTTATAPGDGYTDGSRYLRPLMAVDNVLPDGSGTNRWYSTSMVNPLTVDMGQPVTFNGYRWYTGSNGQGRDPIGWTLEISNNATNWYLADVQTNWFGTLTRNAIVGPWTLDLPERGGPLACAIPNSSRTAVASGATLRLDGADETVGPLSGTGTVTLSGVSALGINGFDEATYAGGINGTGLVTKTGAALQTLSGTLAFSGTMIVDAGVLNLQGAMLTGVTNLVIRSGGELTGSATVNGNLTVTFEGGAYSGNLSVSGKLTVVGTVNLKTPPGATVPFSQTLFTYASADASTRAALSTAITQGVPNGYRANVSVTDTSARLSIVRPGMMILMR